MPVLKNVLITRGYTFEENNEAEIVLSLYIEFKENSIYANEFYYWNLR